jgi:hypothetical protein
MMGIDERPRGGVDQDRCCIEHRFKSDGLISLNEFRDQPNLKIGDEVEVMVVDKEDRNGHLNLSRRQARITRAWERIMEVHKTGKLSPVLLLQNQRWIDRRCFRYGNILTGFSN